MLPKSVLLVLLSGLQIPAQINILTANGGNDRTNSNLQETALSPATVSAANFGKVAAFPVDGQVYAQPLYVSGLDIPGVGTRNVLLVATMANTVYAFDADGDGSAPLWQVSLGQPVPADMLYGRNGDIGGDIGVLSTPAIDLARGVIYVVSDNLVGNAPVLSLHALDLMSGAEMLGGPVALQTSGFDPMQHIQRPGLLLANGAVYVSFGSHADMSPYHGWMMSYDAADLTHQLGVFNSTPSGDGGSIWQSGRGPAADGAGNIYVITGNGDFDGVRNWGQSFLKLAGAASGLVGSFTPADWKSMSDNDADLSAGPALIPGTSRMIGGDKAGNLYLIDGGAMSRSAQIIPASYGSIFNFAVWGRGASAYVYAQGSNDVLQCYEATATGWTSAPISSAVNPERYSRMGLTVSASGSDKSSGIVWQITGNPHDTSIPGTLRAYDAANLANELWNSDTNADDVMGPIMKFVSPTVANGRVYVPTVAGAVMVYGLK
jgi:hypothetical protein